MTSISFDTSKVMQFASVLRTAPTMIPYELITATNRITLQGEAFAKGKVPVRTGHLRRSITHTPAVHAGGTVSGTFGTATPYARPVEFGRRGFSARPRHALGPMNIGGRMIFRHSVGPAKARPFMRPAIAFVRTIVDDEYRAAYARVIAKIRMATG